MCAEEEMMRFIGGACPRSAAWRQWCTLAGAWHIRGFSLFSVIARARGDWVGRLGPWEPDGWPAPEIGYGVSAKFARKGSPFQAPRSDCQSAFQFLALPHPIHRHDPPTPPSPPP